MGVSVGACPFCRSAGSDTLSHGLACALTSRLVARLLPKLELPPLTFPILRGCWAALRCLCPRCLVWSSLSIVCMPP
jgi:hypothetical protein